MCLPLALGRPPGRRLADELGRRDWGQPVLGRAADAWGYAPSYARAEDALEVDASVKPALAATLELEVAAQERCAATADFAESARAYHERRQLEFSGR